MKIDLIKELTIDELSNPLAAVLKNRGVDDIEEFFAADWSVVQDPSYLDNIELAADVILNHCFSGSKIAVIVDCDMDGFTSSALLLNYLEDLRKANLVAGTEDDKTWAGQMPKFSLLFHADKTHGLSDFTIMRQIRDEIKPDLLIIPDASGTQEQYDALTTLGIQIVVLDHHDTVEKGDNEKVIVVNPQHSADYINKQLSGVGVVFQLCRHWDRQFKQQFAGLYLDIVAAGLVSDVMDLRSNETRVLVNYGLNPNNIRAEFLREALISMSFSLKGKLTPTGIGFYIGPLFNAICRIGSIEEKQIVFDSLLTTKSSELVASGKRGAKDKVPLVEEAMRIASNAKGRQKRRQDVLSEKIMDAIRDEGLYEHKVIILDIDDFSEDQRALSGLIANKLMDYYRRPIILVFDNKDGTLSGSCRAPESIEAFQDFREQVNESGLVTFASGHNLAFGTRFPKENLNPLRDYFNKKFTSRETEKSYQVDFLLGQYDEIANIVMTLGEQEHLWGQGIKEPIIALQRVILSKSNMKLMSPDKRPTLKIELQDGTSLIKFGSSKEEYNSLIIPYDAKMPEQCYIVDIVGVPSINEYGGNKYPQLRVLDYDVIGTMNNF